jgi:outer membrane protein OmpA-like peptidoglycan-associated protein
MTTKATVTASTVGASLCAILLSAGPLSAASAHTDVPGAFDVAQRGPDQKNDDDDRKGKGKRHDEQRAAPQRNGSQHNNDQRGRGDSQRNAAPDRKPVNAPHKNNEPLQRKTWQSRDAGEKQVPGRPANRDEHRRRVQGEPKAAPAPAPAAKAAPSPAKPTPPPAARTTAPPPAATPPTRTQARDDKSRDRHDDRRWGDHDRNDDHRRGDNDRNDDRRGGDNDRNDARPGSRPVGQTQPQAGPDRSRDRADDKNGRPDNRRDAQKKDDRRGGDRPWRHTGFGFKDIQKQRKERAEDGGKRTVIEEPDKRIIVREGKRTIIRHDETERFRRGRGQFREERRKDGTRVSIVTRPGGIEIVTELDTNGRLLRRSRRSRGKEFVLIDNRPRHDHHHHRGGGRGFGWFVDLPPPVIHIPREKYIVEYEDASEEDIYDALSAPPVENLERGYSLDEIRESRYLRERMRRVDLDSINFEFGSWDVPDDQFPKLERVARAMNSILRRNPDVVFMIEGHTDAVGSDVDNLSLSDRRAETVASILTEEFEVPPENLVTQGYGEEYLKVQTDGPERANRRVTVLNITPLMARADR